MKREEISKRLKSIIVDVVNEYASENFQISEDDCTDEASLREDLGMDSLDIASAVSKVENELEIRVADVEADRIKIYGDLEKLVMDKFGC